IINEQTIADAILDRLLHNAHIVHFSVHVAQPLFSGCCGMAGDCGFPYPELTHSATLQERIEVCSSGEFNGYYSSSKTCEMALSDAIDENYQSILKLADECTLMEKSPV